MARYHADAPAPTPGAVIPDTLEAVACEGARRMLERALELEVDVFLGRLRYAPGGRDSGYRNGHGRPREIGIGTWSVEVRPPRVSDLPPGAEPFSSALLPKRRYLSLETQRLFARLYLEGLSSGDFEPAFRELLGEKAPLSASTIIRLKATWAADYEAWRTRPIRARYGYLYADGLYLGAGLEPESSCLLVIVVANLRGVRESGLLFALPTYLFGAAVLAPLFNRNEGPIAEAEARRKLAAAEFKSLLASVMGQVSETRLRHEAAVKAWITANGLVQGQTERLRQIEKLIAYGETDRLSLVQGQIELYAAERARLQARINALRALGTVEDAVQYPLLGPAPLSEFVPSAAESAAPARGAK